MVMNKETARKLSIIVNDVLQKGLPKEYGAKLLGGGTYDPQAGTLTLRVVIGPKDNGQESYMWTPEYRKLQELVVYKDEWMNPDHITPEMLQKSFDVPGAGACKLIGYNPRSQKYPYIMRATNGKQYKVNGRSLKFYIGLKP